MLNYIFGLHYPQRHSSTQLYADTGAGRPARTSKPVYRKGPLPSSQRVFNFKTHYHKERSSSVEMMKYETAGYENTKPFGGYKGM